MATQLKVSTLATLVAIIAGGLIWGVSGMILFIPFAGILKIVSDHIPGWEALNILLSRTDGRKKAASAAFTKTPVKHAAHL